MNEVLKKRGHTTLRLLLASLLGMTSLQCSDEPTGTNYPGSSLGDLNVVVKDTVVYGRGSTSFKKYVPMDGALAYLRQNLLGRANGFTASTLIQFLPIGIAQRDTIRVLSARLILHCVAWGGVPSGAWGFNVYRITGPWDQTTVRQDSLPPIDSTTCRTLSGLPYAGTVSADTETVSIPLDTAMVRSWIRQASAQENYGIILTPTGSTNVVRGIQAVTPDSVQYHPTLEVIASNLGGTLFDTTRYTTSVDSYVGDASGVVTDPQLLYVQAGVVYRSTLTFDVSFIKRGSIINSALLQLEQGPGTRVWKFTVDSVLSLHVLRSGTDTSQFESYSTAGRKIAAGGTKFEFDARHAVQLWLREPNYGVVLRQSDASEYSTYDLYTFYNERATTLDRRPRLVIKYTQSPYTE